MLLLVTDKPPWEPRLAATTTLHLSTTVGSLKWLAYVRVAWWDKKMVLEIWAKKFVGYRHTDRQRYISTPDLSLLLILLLWHLESSPVLISVRSGSLTENVGFIVWGPLRLRAMLQHCGEGWRCSTVANFDNRSTWGLLPGSLRYSWITTRIS